ncbi:MAG: hypothetical protein ACLPKB_14300 [Xanthobacteraceae bacterium]
MLTRLKQTAIRDRLDTLLGEVVRQDLSLPEAFAMLREPELGRKRLAAFIRRLTRTQIRKVELANARTSAAFTRRMARMRARGVILARATKASLKRPFAVRSAASAQVSLSTLERDAAVRLALESHALVQSLSAELRVPAAQRGNSSSTAPHETLGPQSTDPDQFGSIVNEATVESNAQRQIGLVEEDVERLIAEIGALWREIERLRPRTAIIGKAEAPDWACIGAHRS